MTHAAIVKAAAGAILTASVFSQAQATRARSGYAPVNGLKMYYEIHGNGAPLVLIHGGLGSTDLFAEVMPQLSGHREVVAVDAERIGCSRQRTTKINLAEIGL